MLRAADAIALCVAANDLQLAVVVVIGEIDKFTTLVSIAVLLLLSLASILDRFCEKTILVWTRYFRLMFGS